MFKTARQSSCTCSSKLHQHNCSKSRHRKYPDKDNSPGNSGSHLPGSRGPQEGVRVYASLPEVCCGEDQISGENFLHNPPPTPSTPYERKYYPVIQMKEKRSVVSDKILLFDRKIDLFKECIMEMSTYFIGMIDRAWSMTLTEVLGSTRRRSISKQPSCCSSMLLSNMDPERWVLFTCHMTDVSYNCWDVILVGEIKFKK